MGSSLKENITGPLFEEDFLNVDTETVASRLIIPEKRKIDFVWESIIAFSYMHIAGIYGIYLVFTSCKIYTIIFAFCLYSLGIISISAGAHRLWAHRSYKAKWPLRLFLVFCHTLTFQYSVIEWVRNHRVHHKYSETDADPHNANRGFFFSHIGWLLCRKHPEVKRKGSCLDFSDLYNDPFLHLQNKYYYILFMPLICFVLPLLIPVYVWGESVHNSWYVVNMLRITVLLNITLLVNSWAHAWGYRPYDKNINPVDHYILATVTFGEGWHNYHHTFPWDYKTSELGNYQSNFGTAFIDLCSKLGLAYDLKTVPEEMVRKRVLRTGDGTHNIWGWGDKDQCSEEKNEAIILS